MGMGMGMRHGCSVFLVFWFFGKIVWLDFVLNRSKGECGRHDTLT